MQTNLITLVFLVAFSFSGLAQTQPLTNAEAEAFKMALQHKMDATQTMQLEFTQTKELKRMQTPLISKGMVFFSADGRLRWEQKTPELNIMVINGNDVYMKDAGGIVKNKGKQLEQLRDLIMRSINGDIMNDPTFKSTFYLVDDHHQVVLKPLGKLKNYVEHLSIVFNANYHVSSFAIKQQSGDKTTLDFENQKPNVKLSDQLFELK